MSTQEAADKWGLPQQLVIALCFENQIDNVTLINNTWHIPYSAKKPLTSKSPDEHISVVTPVKPFLKWAGGKGQLLEEIANLYPFEKFSITKYCEPFVGGGAVLFDILNKYYLDEIFISDINQELINTYIVIRDSVEKLIYLLATMQNEFIPLDKDRRKKYYLEKREQFNNLIISESNSVCIEKAALMIFLNKTCFNGLYRVNKKGLFNVPMGSYKKPLICDEANLRAISKMLTNVSINCGDYRESQNFIDENTFVYFDPPYRPISSTSNFTSYSENAFDDCEQKKLAEYVQELDKLGAKIILSNSDPKNSNPDDDFFDVLYSSFNIKRVEAKRMINSKANARGLIKELLISNF
ncbi:MAG: DNA adenine methylase [Prevotellaceae bacterium]|nr:DNA adenine methylase [Prevotellaceae bacterium]